MICLVLTGRTLQENLEQILRNKNFIDIAELRIDLLEEDQLTEVPYFPTRVNLPIILTCRRVSDGGAMDCPERQRLSILEQASQGQFAYVDLEDDVKRPAFEQDLQSRNIKIIRSMHDFQKIPSDVYHRITRIASRGEIPKIAVTPQSILDLLVLFRIHDELSSISEKIVVGMGDFGVPTRILYKKLGSMLTYCCEHAVAPGQIPAKSMKELYRADRIDDRTRIYGIIGNPVLHTASPLIQNPGFHGINFNAVYVPFLVDSVRSFFTLAETIRITGFSVTVPHKQQVLPYLGKITREVKQIGSCNTVVRAKNLWMGTNTDYYGFIEPLVSDIDSGDIQTAMVVGAGGAARSVVWALRNHGVKVVIVNRDMDKARMLAVETGSSFDSLAEAPRHQGVDLVVQTTSVGMVPDNQGDPVPNFRFTGRETAYDLVYKPHLTVFLQRARQAGCKLLFGIDMLIRQGKLQFETFTGYHYPKRVEISLGDASSSEEP